MAKLITLLGRTIVLASAASFLGLLGVLLVLWMRGYLTDERTWQVWAAVYGIKVEPEPTNTDTPAVQLSYEDVLERRALLALDLDLRQKALDKAAEDLLNQQSNLKVDRDRYNRLLEEFEQRLAELQAGATDRAIQDVRQSLTVMRPEQAKAQLLKMWQDNQRTAVITILRTMTAESRKRILNEFSEAEIDQLYEMFKSTLAGSGEVDLIKGVQQQVDQFQKSQP